MDDKYCSFAELARRETRDVDYRVRARCSGPTLILAPHGGGIEPGTSELAEAIAGDDHSLYLFEGLKPAHNEDLHVTSTSFDEPECLVALQRSDAVLAIHGKDGDTAVVYVGGLDTAAGDRIRAELSRAGFDARPIDRPQLAGESPANICNRGRFGAGVQLEIAVGLRRTFFGRLSSRTERQNRTGEFDRFVTAVRSGLRKQE